ncbi:hypothetical protein GCM10010873_07480 [Cypionkella aquatica]|uniref:DUF3108 domain-containing protein n=1 Tax=Cypionkella aquatica TaxID=1756042 RepID=A0AA37WZK2_9RHOB|nr:hypothetical protein [Cypionkella aquatica]GLS85774.1 hypothetical protein GCM10010873_07480 [Cypionkella aquatica]
MKHLALCALLLTALPAAAECVTPANLAKGVSFTRDDGRQGLIRSEDKRFAIDYAVNSNTAWADKRQSWLGIYDAEWTWVPTDTYQAEGGPGGTYSYRFATKPPMPAAGTTWDTTVTERGAQAVRFKLGPVAISQRDRTSYTVNYRFMAETAAKISGCTYRVMPIEAIFKNQTTDLTRRWIYFPDLGFGLETQVTDRKGATSRALGLTSLTPKG